MALKRVSWLIAMAVAFAAGMVFYEAFLRYSGSSQPAIVESDEDLGLRFRPETGYVFVNEGFSLGRVNRYAYLGPGYSTEKPEGVTRIALMGDSYIAAYELFDRHHFRCLMEEEFNSTPGRRVQILNLGFPAANFEHMYIYYKVLAVRFSPDYVLYFLGTNSLNRSRVGTGPRLRAEGDSMRIDNEFRKSGAFTRSRKLDPFRRFGLFTLLRKARALYASGSTPEIIFDKFYRLVKGASVEDPWARPEPVEDPERMPLNRALVKDLGEMNQQGEVTSIIVVRDGLPQTFVDFAIANGVQCFDPTPALDSLAATGVDPHYWAGSQRTGHWNQYAHRVVGDYLLSKIAPLLD